MTRWPDDRIDEVIKLRKLLGEIALLNNGNRFIERLQSCIEKAEELTKTDWKARRESLMSFIENKAMGDQPQVVPNYQAETGS